jgi:quercetin dioxygenase-like cupin family protein
MQSNGDVAPVALDGARHHPVTGPGCVGLTVYRAPADESAGVAVMHLRFEPGGRMDEHDADHPILFVALWGDGRVRVGGVGSPLRAGEAVLWPAGVLHQALAGESGLGALAIEYGLRGEGR